MSWDKVCGDYVGFTWYPLPFSMNKIWNSRLYWILLVKSVRRRCTSRPVFRPVVVDKYFHDDFIRRFHVHSRPAHVSFSAVIYAIINDDGTYRLHTPMYLSGASAARYYILILLYIYIHVMYNNNRARGTRGPRPTTIKKKPLCTAKAEPESVLHHILFCTHFIIHVVL